MGIFKTIGNVAKGALGVFAPTLASVLPGPLGGVARNIVEGVLRLDPGAKDAEIEKALAIASPEILAEMRAADAKFKLDMKQLDVDLEKVHQEDRVSARGREVSLKDWTPRVLAFGVLGAWGGMTWMLMRGEMPAGNHDLIMVSFGILSTSVVGVISYYFGSSAGSKEKTKLLNGKDS